MFLSLNSIHDIYINGHISKKTNQSINQTGFDYPWAPRIVIFHIKSFLYLFFSASFFIISSLQTAATPSDARTNNCQRLYSWKMINGNHFFFSFLLASTTRLWGIAAHRFLAFPPLISTSFLLLRLDRRFRDLRDRRLRRRLFFRRFECLTPRKNRPRLSLLTFTIVLSF